MGPDTLDLVARLSLGGVLGLVVGIEREAHGHPAGTRTHALVGLGAALFTVVGAYGFGDVRPPNVDPTRVAAQVASGVGFLGAGAIMREGVSVRGLTTAAALWASAALGVAAGAGAYTAAVTTALLLLGLLVGFGRVKGRLVRAPSRRLLEVEYRRGHGTLGPVVREVEAIGGRIEGLRVQDDERADGVVVRRLAIELRARDPNALFVLLETIRRRPEVQQARVG